jgi:hypothetical protein
MGASAFSCHGNAVPFGLLFTHPRASRQMTPPSLSSRTRAGMVERLNFSISAIMRTFISTSLLALCHINTHGIVKL